MKNYLVKEAAAELRCGENVVRRLIADGLLKVMNMPTVIVPDFELERFRQEAIKSQVDLSDYAETKKGSKKESESNLVSMIGGK